MFRILYNVGLYNLSRVVVSTSVFDKARHLHLTNFMPTIKRTQNQIMKRSSNLLKRTSKGY